MRWNIVLAVLAAIVVVVFATYGRASGWDQFLGMFKEKIKPVGEYQIETSGFNLRTYVFELKHQNMMCAFTAGTNKGGLACWKKDATSISHNQ